MQEQAYTANLLSFKYTGSMDPASVPSNLLRFSTGMRGTHTILLVSPYRVAIESWFTYDIFLPHKHD